MYRYHTATPASASVVPPQSQDGKHGRATQAPRARPPAHRPKLPRKCVSAHEFEFEYSVYRYTFIDSNPLHFQYICRERLLQLGPTRTNPDWFFRAFRHRRGTFSP